MMYYLQVLCAAHLGRRALVWGLSFSPMSAGLALSHKYTSIEFAIRKEYGSPIKLPNPTYSPIG